MKVVANWGNVAENASDKNVPAIFCAPIVPAREDDWQEPVRHRENRIGVRALRQTAENLESKGLSSIITSSFGQYDK